MSVAEKITVVTIKRSNSFAAPLELMGDWSGWTFTCSAKKVRKAKNVPPESDPVFANITPVAVADVGNGSPGLLMDLPSAIINSPANELGFCLDVKATRAGIVRSSSPLFVIVSEVVT
jgi:hypothetical protein